VPGAFTSLGTPKRIPFSEEETRYEKSGIGWFGWIPL
jgi:hypothetical protein